MINIKLSISLEIETFVLRLTFGKIFFIFYFLLLFLISWLLLNSRSFLLFAFWLNLLVLWWFKCWTCTFNTILYFFWWLDISYIIIWRIIIWVVWIHHGNSILHIRNDWRLLVKYWFIHSSFLFFLVCKCAACT